MGLVEPYILWGNGILERMEDIAGTCHVMVRRRFIVYRCTHVMCFIDGRMIPWSVLLLEEWLSIYEERRVWLRETRYQSALLCTNFSVLVVLVMRHRRFQASKFLDWCHRVCTSDSCDHELSQRLATPQTLWQGSTCFVFPSFHYLGTRCGANSLVNLLQRSLSVLPELRQLLTKTRLPCDWKLLPPVTPRLGRDEWR